MLKIVKMGLLIFFSVAALKLGLLIFSPSEFNDPEELSRGLIAHEVIHGMAYPVFNYQIDNYSGGSLVMGLLTVPFFMLFGESFFSLKLAAVLFDILAVLFIYLILRKYADRLAAVLAVVFLTLAPYTYTRLSLLSWGDHPQLPALMAAAFLILYKISFSGPLGRRKCFLFGVFCGFCLYFSYHFAVPLALCVLFLLARFRGEFFSRVFLSFSPGFLVGFSPWIYYNLSHDLSGLTINNYGMISALSSPQRAWQRFLEITFFALRDSFSFSPSEGIANKAVSFGYYLVFTVSYCGLLFKNRRPLFEFFRSFIPGNFERRTDNWKELPFLLYIPIFLILVSFTTYSFRNWPTYFADRYFTSLHTCVFVVIALSLSGLLRAKRFPSVLAWVVLIFVLLTGAISQAGIVLRGVRSGVRVAEVFTRPGYDKTFLMDDRVACFWVKSEGDNVLSEIKRCVDPKRRQYLAVSFGKSLGYCLKGDLAGYFRKADSLSSRVPGVKCFIYNGFGYGMGRWHSGSLDEALRLIKNTPQEPCFLEGLKGSVGFWFSGDSKAASVFILNSIPGSLRPGFFNELGVAIARNNKGIYSVSLKDILEVVPSEYRRDALLGMTGESKRRAFGDRKEADKIRLLVKEKIPLKHIDAVLEVISPRDLDLKYKETMKAIAMLGPDASGDKAAELSRGFINAAEAEIQTSANDKNRLVPLRLKLAKILLLSGQAKRALRYFEEVACDKTVKLVDKAYARYFTAKTYLLYLSDRQKAGDIFSGIVEDYEPSISTDTAWAVLWSKLRLAEICEMNADADKAEAILKETADSADMRMLNADDRVFILAFIAEKFYQRAEMEICLKTAEKGLDICRRDRMVDFDWARDWLNWIKMRLGNRYYLNGRFPEALELYSSLSEAGVFDDPRYLREGFWYNLYYNPKPFRYDLSGMCRELSVCGKVIIENFKDKAGAAEAFAELCKS